MKYGMIYLFIKEIMKEIKKLELVFIDGLIKQFIKENGKIIK